MVASIRDTPYMPLPYATTPQTPQRNPHMYPYPPDMQHTPRTPSPYIPAVPPPRPTQPTHTPSIPQGSGQSGRSSRPTAPPPSAAANTPHIHAADTAAMAAHSNEQEMHGRRALEYYGPSRAIMVAVGYDVLNSNAHGVLIKDPYYQLQHKIIPWHRVHELRADPDDSILHY